MALKIKRRLTTETIDNLATTLPLYLTDEFNIWYYAVLDENTVLVVSCDSCQVQTFDETFNSKYSIDFDELKKCDAASFNEVYSHTRERLGDADRKLQSSLAVSKSTFTELFIESADHLRAAS
ncbi:hypothetical protein [Xanthocytophaga flava]|uniref:hypothetical protein n=1 Tax=Xanthocytophaga flava TaxID=3048013 RepID=UPI0028D75043|nr:hypothetical protein [Xanthocytophaga flavus]MDJ1472462.1 hypothetical protein [Xanthocytophaga flavus]